MKKLFLVAIVFALVAVFNINSNSQQSQQTNLLDVKSSDVHSEKAPCMVCQKEYNKGKGKKLSYLGKNFEFCSTKCRSDFKAESIKYTAGVATCPICNHDDATADISMTHKNTKYYFCNDGCKTKFSKDPEKVLENYNK